MLWPHCRVCVCAIILLSRYQLLGSIMWFLLLRMCFEIIYYRVIKELWVCQDYCVRQAANHTICFTCCSPLVIIIMTSSSSYYYYFSARFTANFGTNPWRNEKWEKIGNPHLRKFQTMFSNWSVSNNLVTELHPIRLLGVATLQTVPDWPMCQHGGPLESSLGGPLPTRLYFTF